MELWLLSGNATLEAAPGCATAAIVDVFTPKLTGDAVCMLETRRPSSVTRTLETDAFASGILLLENCTGVDCGASVDPAEARVCAWREVVTRTPGFASWLLILTAWLGVIVLGVADPNLEGVSLWLFISGRPEKPLWLFAKPEETGITIEFVLSPPGLAEASTDRSLLGNGVDTGATIVMAAVIVETAGSVVAVAPCSPEEGARTEKFTTPDVKGRFTIMVFIASSVEFTGEKREGVTPPKAEESPVACEGSADSGKPGDLKLKG